MTAIANRLIGIVDLRQIVAREQRVEHVIANALGAGMQNFVLRTKEAPSACIERVDWSELILQIEHGGGRVILHDSLLRVRPALAACARFQHWSISRVQELSKAGRSEEKTNPVQPFGVSTHNLEQLRFAQKLGASWAFISPWAASASKDYAQNLLTEGMLQTFAEHIAVPRFVLSGIDAETIADLPEGLVSGCAVMGMLTNPEANLQIRALLHRMESKRWAMAIPW